MNEEEMRMSVTSQKALPHANGVEIAIGTILSYEGTREMNTLIVGRAITGFSAFV